MGGCRIFGELRMDVLTKRSEVAITVKRLAKTLWWSDYRAVVGSNPALHAASKTRESEPVRLRLGGSFVCGKVCLLRLPGKQTGRKIDVIPLRYPKPE